MKNKTAFSKWLQVLVLLTFFLPFFPKGCESKKAEEAPKADSIKVATKKTTENITVDSSKQLAIDTTNIDTVNVKTTSAATNENKVTDESLSETIMKKYKFLTPVLRPAGNYSGIGYVIDSIQYFVLFGAVLAFLLFIIGLFVKLKDYNSIFHLVNDMALISLIFAYGSNPLNPKPLWGYWVCMALAVIMVVYDTIRMFKSKKKPYKK
jgi:hypothetical protein